MYGGILRDERRYGADAALRVHLGQSTVVRFLCACARVCVCVHMCGCGRFCLCGCVRCVHVSQPVTPSIFSPLSDSWFLWGLAGRGETLSGAHPGGEGLPAHPLSHQLGPCVCGSPALDPLGRPHCRRTSALSNLLVHGKTNNYTSRHSSQHPCDSPTSYNLTFNNIGQCVFYRQI